MGSFFFVIIGGFGSVSGSVSGVIGLSWFVNVKTIFQLQQNIFSNDINGLSDTTEIPQRYQGKISLDFITIMGYDDNMMMNKETKMKTNLTPTEVLYLTATATFHSFDKLDWMTFGGCESENPMIATVYDDYAERYTIVLDGEILNIIHEDDGSGGQVFELKGLH